MRDLAQRRLNLSQVDVSKLSQDQLRGLLVKQIGADIRTVVERIISPECLFAISLALPERNGLPLTRKTAEPCKPQVDAVNFLLSAWKAGQVPVR